MTHLRLVSFPHSKGYAVKMREQESQAHQVYANLVEHVWDLSRYAGATQRRYDCAAPVLGPVHSLTLRERLSL